MSRTHDSTEVESRPLLQRAAQGDRAAATACIEQLGPHIVSLVERFGLEGEEADRAVRAIFRRLWSQASRARPGLAQEAEFAVLVARRWLLDWRARSKVEGAAGAPPALPDASAAAQQADLFGPGARVVQALASLDPEDRSVLELAVLGALPYERIAAHLDASSSGVRDRARRSLTRMGELLHGQREGRA